jgi:hypothetical protein
VLVLLGDGRVAAIQPDGTVVARMPAAPPAASLASSAELTALVPRNAPGLALQDACGAADAGTTEGLPAGPVTGAALAPGRLALVGEGGKTVTVYALDVSR